MAFRFRNEQIDIGLFHLHIHSVFCTAQESFAELKAKAMKLLWVNVVILMLVGMVKTAPPPSSDSVVCKKTEFDCELGTRRCIPQGWFCDGITDCDNWKDELDCPVSHICPEGSFQCRGQNKCIPSEYVCDGEVDCANHSDEESCLPDPTPSNTTSSAPTTPKTDEPDSSNQLAMFSCVFMVILKLFLF